jgi:hypothetical protein
LLGNGDGTFQPAIAAAPIGQMSAIVIKDVNGDGKLDQVAGAIAGGVAVFLGNGDGTFQTATSVLATGSFAVAGVNGDGKPDLISSQTFTQVFLGNGDGTFTLKSSVFGSLPLNSPSLLVADFNGDGKADLAVNNTLLFGNGDGTFQGNPALTLGDTDVFGSTVQDGGNPVLPGAVGDFGSEP